MKAAEIETEEDLKLWLEGQSRETCVWIAARAAARRLPVFLREAVERGFQKDTSLTALQVCRALQAPVSFMDADDEAVKVRLASTAAAASYDLSDAWGGDSAFTAKATGVVWAAALASRVLGDGRDAIRVIQIGAVAHNLITPVLEDARWAEAEGIAAPRALWPEGMPDDIAQAWQATLDRLPEPSEDEPDYRSFWVRWYQGLLDGNPAFPRALTEAVALIDDEDWQKGDLHVNNIVIPRLMAAHLPTLLDASPVDFSFDAFARVMRMIGIDNDTAHLREPALVRAFEDDCEELVDTLQDFKDYADALSGGGNRAGVLALSVDKVLKELRRTSEKTHIRARYLVGLCHDLEVFSKEEQARADLGQGLSSKLDTGVGLLQTVTRKHLAPAYTALLPLSQLSLDHVDQDEVVRLLDDMVVGLESLPSNDLVALDEDGLSVFRDMVRETKEFRAAITEASTDEFRAILEERFVVSAGGTGLAFGKFLQRASSATGATRDVTDVTIKNFQRARSLRDIFDALSGVGGGAP